MSEMVGLSRNLKIKWLNKTVELLAENLSEDDFKSRLNDYLGFEIKSPTNVRKTRELMMNIWYYDKPGITDLRKRALELIHQDTDNDVLCNWGLMLYLYPVFVDVSRIIGKLSEFEDEITTQQIRQKLFDEWGERATIFHSLDKIIATMKDFGVLETLKQGRYKVVKRKMFKPGIAEFIVNTIILVENKDSCMFEDLSDVSYMFPFDYSIQKEALMMDEHFDISNIAGNMMVGMK